jgi:hypothetical protein
VSSGADVAFASVLSCALLVVAVGFSVVGDLSTFVLETPCTWCTSTAVSNSTAVSTSAAAACLLCVDVEGVESARGWFEVAMKLGNECAEAPDPGICVVGTVLGLPDCNEVT